MKNNGFTFVLFAWFALTLPVAAQNRVKLFDASVVGGTTTIANMIPPNGKLPIVGATEVATASAFVDCSATTAPAATITGPAIPFGGWFFVDNFFTITTTAVFNMVQAGASTERQYTCRYEFDGKGCFNAFNGNSQDNGNIGKPAIDYYSPIPPVDVSASMVPGVTQVLQVDLMDAGVMYGHSEINLSTTCIVPVVTTLCHQPGTPAQKTMYNLPNSSVPGHLDHGDKLGACAN